MLKKDLNFTGSLSHARYDYAGYNFRKKYHSFNSENEFLEDFSKEKTGLKILNADLENLDSLRLPVKDIYNISIDGQVNQIGDELYFNPLFYDKMDENPFRLEDRKYPVDFSCLTEKNVIVNISLPANYVVTGLPKPVQMSLPDKSASFLYQVSDSGNGIMLNFRYTINKAVFAPAEYAALREFFINMIAKNAETVTLKVN